MTTQQIADLAVILNLRHGIKESFITKWLTENYKDKVHAFELLDLSASEFADKLFGTLST